MYVSASLRLGSSRKLRSLGIGAAIAVGASLGLLAPAAMAAPPVNDNFAERTAIGDELPVHISESNVDATKETGEQINEFGKGRSIWWEWESPLTGWVTVSVCGSEMHSYVNVFEEGSEVAHLTSLTARRGNGDEGPQCWASNSTYTFAATAGDVYEIGADGNGYYVPPPPGEGEAVIPSGEGTIALSIEATPLPPNDSFASPIQLGGNFHEVHQSPFEPPNSNEYFNEQVTGYNWGATKEAGEPDHAGDPGGASVWYAWTPTRSGEARLSLQGGGSGPKLLALYQGSTLAGLIPLASSATGPYRSAVAPVTAGVEYRIAVDGSPTEHTGEPQWDPFMGSFEVNLQLISPPLAVCPAGDGGCGGTPAPPLPSPPAPLPIFPAVTLGSHQVKAGGHQATFRFSSSSAGASFVCKLDGKAYRACASPFKVKGLKPGKHVFRVLAALNGTTSTSPAIVHFTVPSPQRRHHKAG